ncbi:hypothetical protein HK096_010776 [Nowakowskiella sp. JEL0078]|nr:hypothetical protein HK096_010776 [Nowakowskiella sp. JEL0078]
MATTDELKNIYESFCSFGSTRNNSSGSLMDINGSTMDGAKFAKFARDTKIVDGKKITITDIDIIFNKVKAKSSRRIDWNEFQNALYLIAEKKYPGKPVGERTNILTLDICRSQGPVSKSTEIKTDGVYGKLSSNKNFTGSQKLRFDDLETTAQEFVSNLASNDENPINRGHKREQASIVTASSERLDLISSSPKKSDTRNSKTNLASSSSKTNVSRLTSNVSTSGSNSNISFKTKPSVGGIAVFDRLTNSQGYTGTHKQRFNSDGTGRGLAGRESIPLGRGPGTYRFL